MALSRASAMRSSFAKLRLPHQSRRTPFTRFNRPARRGYASEHGGGHDGGVKSDLPWLVSAVAVTVPATYLILANGDTSSSHKEPGDEYHGEGGDHDEDSGDDEGGDEGGDGGDDGGEEKDGDGEEKEGDGDGEEKSDEGEEKAEAKSEDKGDDKPEGGDGSDSGGDGQQQQQDDKSDDKGETKDSDKQEGEDKEQKGSNDKKRDPMGASRRKIENPNAKIVGGGNEVPGDSAASSKEPVKGQMSGQQKGLSNTDTKHSYNVDAMGGSKKSEGTAETAKVQGTVNPSRSQV